MTNTTSAMKDGILHPEQGLDHLSHILNYCQTRNVTVMFGDWGGGLVDSRKETINEENLTAAAEYVRFLIEEKGFSCIRYYNLINEPNGYWSSTDGKYPLWARAVRFFHKKLKEKKLTYKLQIVGPDVAIWSANESWWTDSCAIHLNNEIGLYDIHTYPSKSTVNSGAYTDIIRAYKQNVPTGKKSSWEKSGSSSWLRKIPFSNKRTSAELRAPPMLLWMTPRCLFTTPCMAQTWLMRLSKQSMPDIPAQ